MLDPDQYPDPDSINPYPQLRLPADLLESVELMNDGARDDGDELPEARHPLHCRQVGGEGRRVQHNIADTLNTHSKYYYQPSGRRHCTNVFSPVVPPVKNQMDPHTDVPNP
jgi:hypothetical protein